MSEEPKGYCPFCDCHGWEICEHFVGYLAGDATPRSRGNKTAVLHRELLANEVAVETPVSVRVYRTEESKLV